jgi:malonyl-CoA O-methyltransferase
MASASPDPRADKRRIRRHFERAAARYAAAAVLHREVEQRMLERLDLVKLQPHGILDVGAGPGSASHALGKRYRAAQVIALDIAHAMLVLARRGSPWYRRLACVCADLEALPIAAARIDLIFSNLTLQWAASIESAFTEFRRVLRPGGLLMFSTFGPDTLKELRAAWSAADGFEHVNRFVDMHDIGDALVQTGFAEPVMDMEMFTLTYDDVRAVMADLKAIGADTVLAGHRTGLTGKARLAAMIDAYERFRWDGRLPATYEVVYGHAWMPVADVGRPARAVTFQPGPLPRL